MSWNTTSASWSFLPTNDQATCHEEDKKQKRSQWCRTQPMLEQESNSPLLPQSYRTWKSLNDVTYPNSDDPQTKPNTQQFQQHYMRPPENQFSGARPGALNNNYPGNFNYSNPTNYQKGSYSQPSAEQFSHNKRSVMEHTSSANEMGRQGYNTTHGCHPAQEFQVNTAYRYQPQFDSNNNEVMSLASSNFPRRPNTQGYNPNERTKDSFGGPYNDYTPSAHMFSVDDSCRHQPYPTRGAANRMSPDRSDANSINGHMFTSATNPRDNALTIAKESASSRTPSKLWKNLKTSLRVVTCSTEAIHLWKGTLGEDIPVVFELFGTASRVEYDGEKISLDLKGRTLHVPCTFFCMDQDPPALTNGTNIRVIGRFDIDCHQFQCVSIRQATDDEISFAMKLVQTCNKSLHTFNILRNEL